MTLESTQSLTEMSTRNLPVDKERPAPKADNLNTICEPVVYKRWEPRRLTTLWDSTACYRGSFTFLVASIFTLEMQVHARFLLVLFFNPEMYIHVCSCETSVVFQRTIQHQKMAITVRTSSPSLERIVVLESALFMSRKIYIILHTTKCFSNIPQFLMQY
jgi:hypothetical protein